MALPPVPGRTRTTVDVRPGQATLLGVVMGPEGPLGGAVVHAERLVGDAAASVDVVSGLDGRWSIPAIKGGRYRVRAWRSPEFALIKPELVFLASSDARELILTLERHGGPLAVGATAPDPPVVNEPANLAVRLVERTVDERGVVRATPSPGVQLDLSGPGQWQVRSPNPAVTDPAGVARWEVTCMAPGVQPLAVVPVGAALAVAVSLPACRTP